MKELWQKLKIYSLVQDFFFFLSKRKEESDPKKTQLIKIVFILFTI